MHRLAANLYPICRSITGDGMRQSLRILSEVVPIVQYEVPSGTKVLDWTVPMEWNVRDAWIADPTGKRWAQFSASNLHVVNYSVPMKARMTLGELRPHLHSMPAFPDRIPYRTTYYAEDWGFCLSHSDLEQLPEGEYEVFIDSTLQPGHLTYGECVLPGASDNEILISVHCCHPSLANDNLSGMAVGAFLAKHLWAHPRAHTFRFLFIPGTIGSITWLELHRPQVSKVAHGLVLSCLGDRGHMSYKRSRRGDAKVDRAAAHVLRAEEPRAVSDFVPYGYDERQYCSPGFNLPVGCLTRTPNGKYPEYHSSADDLDFISADCLEDSLDKALAIVEILEHDAKYTNLSPFGEPQLGRRGLYGTKGGTSPGETQMAMLWVLSFSDGHHSLLEIAERAGMDFHIVAQAASALCDANLLARETEMPVGAVAEIAPGTGASGPGSAALRLRQLTRTL